LSNGKTHEGTVTTPGATGQTNQRCNFGVGPLDHFLPVALEYSLKASLNSAAAFDVSGPALAAVETTHASHPKHELAGAGAKRH
jgi:hypothetical protein